MYCKRGKSRRQTKKKYSDDEKNADACSAAGGRWDSVSAFCLKDVDKSWIGKNLQNYGIAVSVDLVGNGQPVCADLGGVFDAATSICTIMTSNWEFVNGNIGRTRIQYQVSSPSRGTCDKMFGGYVESYQNGKCIVLDSSELHALTFIHN